MSPSPWPWLGYPPDEPGGAEVHWLRELSAAVRDHATISAVGRRIAELAVDAVDGADGVGFATVVGGECTSTAASSQFIADVNALQCTRQQGPGLTAVEELRTVYVGSLSEEERWPHFSVGASRLGVGSVLALPLRSDDEAVGCLNVYARQRFAFVPEALRAGERFAAVATLALTTSRLLASSRGLGWALEQLLSERAVVETAVGILMHRTQADADAAWDQLTAIAASGHESVEETAWSIVADAIAWSTRHTEPRRWPEPHPKPPPQENP